MEGEEEFELEKERRRKGIKNHYVFADRFFIPSEAKS
jgi:hypothetical protein